MRFFIEGIPKPQPRPRGFSRGKFIKFYSETTEWKKQVKIISKLYCKEGVYFDQAIEVNLNFQFHRPKSHYRSGKFSHLLKDSAPEYHIFKPDKDNLEKAVTDGLTDGGLFSDDCIIIQGFTSKKYIHKEESSGCWIEVNFV